MTTQDDFSIRQKIIIVVIALALAAALISVLDPLTDKLIRQWQEAKDPAK